MSFTAFQVQYQSDLFLDKNKDYVVPEHRELLSASRCSFVSGLFRSPTEENAKPSKFSAIGSRLENAKPSKFSSIGSRFKVSSHHLFYTSIAIFRSVNINWKINFLWVSHVIFLYSLIL